MSPKKKELRFARRKNDEFFYSICVRITLFKDICFFFFLISTSYNRCIFIIALIMSKQSKSINKNQIMVYYLNRRLIEVYEEEY